MKQVPITGVTGQDGAYLAEFLPAKGPLSTASSAVRACSTPIASTTWTRIRTIRTGALSSTTSRINALGCKAKKPLREGLEAAYAWFVRYHGDAKV